MGKTTILKLSNRLLRPQSGVVPVEGDAFPRKLSGGQRRQATHDMADAG